MAGQARERDERMAPNTATGAGRRFPTGVEAGRENGMLRLSGQGVMRLTSRGQLPRLAMADWGDAWLTRQDPRRGEYHPLERLIGELAERGYNALRIDAFPHLVAPRSDGVVIERFQLLGAERDAPLIQPRRELVRLATLAREHGIRLWLTSRFLPDTQARRNFVRRPGDFVDVWLHTLSWLDRAGVLDAVVAVDFCHEFGAPASTPPARQRIFQRRLSLARLPGWSAEAEARAEAYLQEVPRALRAAFGRIAFGVSANQATAPHIRQMDTSELDFLDAHIWVDDDPLTGLFTGLRPPAGAARTLHARAMDMALRLGGSRWLRGAEAHLEDLSEFARLRRLAPVAAGGWLRWPEADRGTIQEVAEALVCAGLAAGVPALITTSRARPEHVRLWADVDWHRYLTGMIRTGY